MSETGKHKMKRNEVQLTPGRGLGRRARGEVVRNTPLKRKARVQMGVCGETLPLRTPRKPETPRRKRMRSTAVPEVHVEVPAVEGLIPQTSLVIKSNPLYNGTVEKRNIRKTEADVEMSTPCDGARNPFFYGQRRNIRKTKEQEMIAAIMDLAQYGKKKVGKKSRTKTITNKAKALLGRHKSQSDITKPTSPVRKQKGAFFLRPRRRKD